MPKRDSADDDAPQASDEGASRAASPHGLIVIRCPTSRQLGRRFLLEDAPVHVGRSSSCEIVVDGDDASRCHCRFEPRGEGWLVRDLESMNGTRVGDDLVEERVLEHGDVIWIGTTALKYITHRPPVEPRDHIRVTRCDGLTGALTRWGMERWLEREYHASAASRALGAIAYDVDGLAAVNERHSALAGDFVLRQLVREVQACLPLAEVACRYRFPDLAVLLPDASREETVARAEMLRARVERRRFRFGAASIFVTISLGCAQRGPGQDPMELLAEARRSLEQAKLNGRNLVCAPAAPVAPSASAAASPPAVRAATPGWADRTEEVVPGLRVPELASFRGREVELVRLLLAPIGDAEDDGARAALGFPPDVALALARYDQSHGTTVQLDGWVFGDPVRELGVGEVDDAPERSVALARGPEEERLVWRWDGTCAIHRRHSSAEPLELQEHVAQLVRRAVEGLRGWKELIDWRPAASDLAACASESRRLIALIASTGRLPAHLLHGDPDQALARLVTGAPARAWLDFFEAGLSLARADIERAVDRRYARSALARVGVAMLAVRRGAPTELRGEASALTGAWSTLLDERYRAELRPYSPGDWKRDAGLSVD